MIDSTNPRVMADNIRHLSGKSVSQGNAITALGSYSTDEIDTGMKLGDDPIYRKVFNIEAFPNNATLNIAHGITNLGTVVSLDAVLLFTEGHSGSDFPFGSNRILYTLTNISIITTTDLSYAPGILVIEYTKSAAPTSDLAPAPSDTRSIEPEEIPEDEYIEPEVIEEAPEEEPIEEPIQEVKKTTRKKSTN